MVFSFICHCRPGLVGRVVVVAVIAWLPLYHFRNSSNFAWFYECCMLFFFICHGRAGLVGRVVAVAVKVVEHC